MSTILVSVWVAAAQAADEADTDERLVAVGLHLGPRIPLDPFALAVMPRAEVGVLIPGLREHLLVFATVAVNAPNAAGTGDDPRVGGPYDWDLTMTQLQLGAGLAVDFAAEGWHVHPELALAPQIFFLRTRGGGAAGSEPFGDYVEKFSAFGGVGALGLGIDAGPGRVLVRVEAAIAPMDSTITGQFVNVGLSPTLGYRLLL